MLLSRPLALGVVLLARAHYGARGHVLASGCCLLQDYDGTEVFAARAAQQRFEQAAGIAAALTYYAEYWRYAECSRYADY